MQTARPTPPCAPGTAARAPYTPGIRYMFARRWVAVLMAAMCMGGNAVAASAAAADKPPVNVIWILLDALRAHNLSVYGYDRQTTPNLEALADDGVVMMNNFSQGLWTTISVPSYMTGKYFPVMVHEPTQATEIIREVPKGEKLLPEIMRENGYTATMITSHSWFTPKSRLWNAFDEAIYVPPANADRIYYAEFEQVNGVVFDWLAKRESTKPFFLYVHTLDTHFPHVVDPPYDKWIHTEADPNTLGKGGEPKLRYGAKFSQEDREHLRGLYDGSLLYADVHLGKLLDHFREKGLLENTLVVVSADHGDMLGEDGTRWGHIAYSSDWIMKTPLLMAGPGLPKGRHMRGLSENVDIVPTIVDLLDLKTEAETDGRSLLPELLNQPEAKPREYVFTKYVSGGYDGVPALIVRSRDHKYRILLNAAREEALWQAPDTAPSRFDQSARAPGVLETMRDWTAKHVVPKWDAYNRLPSSAIYLSLNRSIENVATPANALVQHSHGDKPETITDGKWAYDYDWQILWTKGWEETVAPLTLTYPVQNGRYILQLEMWSEQSYLGYPASAVEVRVEGEKEFRRVVRDKTPAEEKGFYYVDVDNYLVEDGNLEVTLKGGGPGHWSMIKALRLLPISDARTSTEEDDARLEQLRALGYLE